MEIFPSHRHFFCLYSLKVERNTVNILVDVQFILKAFFLCDVLGRASFHLYNQRGILQKYTFIRWKSQVRVSAGNGLQPVLFFCKEPLRGRGDSSGFFFQVANELLGSPYINKRGGKGL